MIDAVYEDRGDGVVFATDYSRGPWDPNAQHGGAPAALLMRAFERCDTGGADVQIARVTYELLRPVPLGELRLEARVVRPGKRVQLLEGFLATPDGLEVVRARAVRVAPTTASSDDADPPPAGPEHGHLNDFRASELKLFPRDTMELRFIDGAFYERGPSTAWFRMRVPLIPGETPSGLQRLAAAADFPNGIASTLSWDDWVFINPDLTIYVAREPIGEWICLEARMRVEAGGVGLSEAVLYDSRGRVGRSLQSLYVAPRG